MSMEQNPTFYCADKYDDEVGLRVELSRVGDTVVDLVRPLGLLQSSHYHLHR